MLRLFTVGFSACSGFELCKGNSRVENDSSAND